MFHGTARFHGMKAANHHLTNSVRTKVLNMGCLQKLNVDVKWQGATLQKIVGCIVNKK